MNNILKWITPPQRSPEQIAYADATVTSAILAIQAEVEKIERAAEILQPAYPREAAEFLNFAKAIDKEAGKAFDTAVCSRGRTCRYRPGAQTALRSRNDHC